MYKVLIVDDENKSRLLMAELVLEILPDATLVQADSANQALFYMQETQFDILFTDIVMPQLDGLSFIAELQKHPKKPYVVLISAYREFEYARKALKYDVSGYLLKPLVKEDVERVLHKFINQQTLPPDENKKILLPAYNGIFPVDTESIIAVEKADRNLVTIYTYNACMKNIRGTLMKIFNTLPDSFMYINRQCIVRKEAIRHFNPKNREVTLLCEEQEVSFICSRKNMRYVVEWFDTAIFHA